MKDYIYVPIKRNLLDGKSATEFISNVEKDFSQNTKTFRSYYLFKKNPTELYEILKKEDISLKYFTKKSDIVFSEKPLILFDFFSFNEFKNYLFFDKIIVPYLDSAKDSFKELDYNKQEIIKNKILAITDNGLLRLDGSGVSLEQFIDSVKSNNFEKHPYKTI